MSALGWRYFRWHEIREAKLWAAAGGVALHDNEGRFPFRRWRRTAHLIAQDAAALVAAGREIGLRQAWLQRDASLLHYDVFGSPLHRAVAKCENAPASWPAFAERELLA